ncbi:MAG: SiaC family regulatory phosphoprotein [Bacteroidales bacterium]|nr:SiaC family regulatory phosphoprotein [Bacteroidales bacterium]MBN2820814.1 SiaC family regulatory phosphoprotein [Bacteroidales bacterium]
MGKFLLFLQKLKESDMLTFRIEARKTSPEVIIDKKNHSIDISGSSTFQNTSWFYSNVLKWAIAFNQEGAKTTTINLRLKKINDNSTKWIMLIMRKMATIIPGHNVVVNWYYQPENVNMQISGERLKLNSLIPVNLIAA